MTGSVAAASGLISSQRIGPGVCVLCVCARARAHVHSQNFALSICTDVLSGICINGRARVFAGCVDWCLRAPYSQECWLDYSPLHWLPHYSWCVHKQLSETPLSLHIEGGTWGMVVICLRKANKIHYAPLFKLPYAHTQIWGCRPDSRWRREREIVTAGRTST